MNELVYGRCSSQRSHVLRFMRLSSSMMDRPIIRGTRFLMSRIRSWDRYISWKMSENSMHFSQHWSKLEEIISWCSMRIMLDFVLNISRRWFIRSRLERLRLHWWCGKIVSLSANSWNMIFSLEHVLFQDIFLTIERIIRMESDSDLRQKWMRLSIQKDFVFVLFTSRMYIILVKNGNKAFGPSRCRYSGRIRSCGYFSICGISTDNSRSYRGRKSPVISNFFRIFFLRKW